MIFLIYVCLITSVARGCMLRDFGNGDACVCNSTYCDLPEPLPDLQPLEFVTYTSSMAGLRFEMAKQKVTTDAKGIDLNLNASKWYQSVEGFGGAVTDAVGINIASLSEPVQDKLMEAYFSPLGIGYTFARIPIAGSDFSTRPYTYADNEKTQLNSFRLAEEDFVYKLPLLKKASNLSDGALRIMAAAWTAPPWMKTNNEYVGGSLKKEYYQDWAEYHIKFLEAYRENGVSIWGISTGNEPAVGNIPFNPINHMGWTPANQRKWVVEHMGPALKQSSYNNTKLLAYDDLRLAMSNWLNVEFKDERVSKFVSGIAVHFYFEKLAPLEVLDKAHNLLPDKFILSTEASFSKKPYRPSSNLDLWTKGEKYAESVINIVTCGYVDIMGVYEENFLQKLRIGLQTSAFFLATIKKSGNKKTWNMNHWVAGWVDWNIALDSSGGPSWADNRVDAAVIVNSTADEFYKQPMFYALGHFSKFVPVGSKRIYLSDGSSDIKSIAFHTPDNHHVIVLLNKINKDEKISIKTDGNKVLRFIVPKRSIVTVISRG